MRIATSSIIDDRDDLITGIRTIRFNPSCPAYSGYSYNIDVNSIIELKCDDATGEKTVVYDTKYEPLYSGRGSKLIHDIEIDVDIDNWVDMTLKKAYCTYYVVYTSYYCSRGHSYCRSVYSSTGL